MIFSPEQENFLALAVIIVEVIPSKLRDLFKASWQKKFRQPWGDNKASGKIFIIEERKMKGKFRDKAVEKFIEIGDTSKWDSTTLFAALLYSKLNLLDSGKRSMIDAIRACRVRRNWFAHVLKTEVPKDVYEQMINDIAQIYKGLGWDEAELTRMKDQFEATPSKEELLSKWKVLMLQEKERNEKLELMLQKIDSLEKGQTENNERLDRVERSNKQLERKLDDLLEDDGSIDNKESSRCLREYYKSTYEKCTIPFINDEKEIKVAERPRSTFMVSLKLADSQSLDEDLKIANEIPQYFDIFNNAEHVGIEEIVKKETRRTFVRGVAGIGKTSLVEHITLSWATENFFGDLSEFDFVFLIKCRYIDAFKVDTINEDFNRQFGIDPEKLRACGDRVLVIIDGLDEIAALAEDIPRNSVINLLLTKDSSFIPGHYTIFTGRSHVEPVIRQNELFVTGKLRQIEVIGLEVVAKNNFVKNFCAGNSKLKARILEFINSPPSIAALATVPQYLNSLCCILAIEREDIKIEKTSTLYIWIFVSFIRHHMKEFNKFPYEILKDKNFLRFLKVMSKISYDLLVQNKIVFKQGDFQDFDDVIAKDEKVAMMLESFIIKKKASTGFSYQYRHLTLHEFLAAVYCFREDIDITQLLDMKLFQIVKFVAGFVSAERAKTDETVDKLFVRSIGKAKTGCQSCKVIANTLLRRFFYSNYELNRDVLLDIFYEFDADDEVAMSFDFRNSKFCFAPLSPVRCMMLIHFIELFLKNNNQAAFTAARLFIKFSCVVDSKLNYKLMQLCYCFHSVYLFLDQIEIDGLKMSLEEQIDSTNLKFLAIQGGQLDYQKWKHLAPCVPLVENFVLICEKFDKESCQLVVNVLIDQRKAGQCRTKSFELVANNFSTDVQNQLLRGVKEFINVVFTQQPMSFYVRNNGRF